MRPLPLLVMLAALACKKDEPAAPPPPPPIAKAAPGDAAADASAPLVDRFRAVPVTVTVSSTVKNPKILPAHLVDRDLDTAWNSVTGELAGSWFEVALPAGATAAEVRMTVGHTGHGAHGEDYFTMNPRIKSVSVWSGDKLIGKVPLDIAKRTLQTIAARATGSVRIEVDEIVPGTQKGWRETCVSELEVWGTPPPGWTPPKAPLVPVVVVQPPPPPPASTSTRSRRASWTSSRAARRSSSSAITRRRGRSPTGWSCVARSPRVAPSRSRSSTISGA